ncbi:50S ribosomal protein L6, partial [Paenibacillus polymyxa]|nr:50S ribosomal protein L6 [Paenibacillus polymyxa]
TRHFAPEIELHQEGDEINFTRPDDSYKAIHGTMRANLNNMVVGVTEGYKKEMKLVGVGYRAQKQGEKLVLNVGYSHPVEMTAPKGVTVEVPSTTQIIISGISKQVVGQFAAVVRSV